jgi:hypothetical protein
MSDDTKQLFGVLSFLLIVLGMSLYFGKQCHENNSAKIIQCIQAGREPWLCEKAFDLNSN